MAFVVTDSAAGAVRDTSFEPTAAGLHPGTN